MKIHPKKRLAATVLAAGLIHQPLWAQTAPMPGSDATSTSPKPSESTEAKPDKSTQDSPAKSENSGEKKVEKIIVTGSRIRKIDVEGPQPVITVSKEAIEKSGAANVGEVLNNMSTASFGSFKSGGGYDDTDYQTINIRGLGSDKTLVLLNGKRLHKDPYFETTDLTNIPVTAIDRVEILKGTASAVYGSDALGGVVNIITKKDYDGSEFSYYRSKPIYGGGDEEYVSLATGAHSEKASNTTFVMWRHTSPFYAEDRPWIQFRNSSIGVPASYVGADGKLHTVGDCAAPRKDSTGESCTYDALTHSPLSGESERLNLLDEFTYKITNKTEFYSRFNITSKRTSLLGGVNGADIDDNFTVSADRIDALVNQGKLSYDGDKAVSKGEPVGIRTRFVEAGRSKTESDSLAVTTTMGVKQKMFDDIELDFSVNDSRVKRESGFKNRLHIPTVQKMIDNGDFDVFADPGNRGSLDSAKLNAYNTLKSSTRTYDLAISGDIDTSLLPVSYAIGGTHLKENYKNENDPMVTAGNVLWMGGGGGEGKREVNSTYLELSASPTKSIEVSVAGRYDKYSDFGSTTNPQLALSWRPINSVLIKGSAGNGFKAPSLRDLHDEEATYYTSVNDFKLCDKATADNNAEDIDKYCQRTQSVEIIAGGNELLKEEKSTSYNIAVGFEPIPENGISFEYWNTEIKGEIASPDSDEVMKMEAAGRPLPSGVTIERDATTGDVKRINLPPANIAAIKANGFDTAVYGAVKTSAGKFGISTQYSRVNSYKTEKIPGVGFSETVGENGEPRWRVNNTLTYGILSHDISFMNYIIGKHEKNRAVAGNIPSYSRWDAQYTWTHGYKGSLLIGYKNIFKKDPPRDETAGVNGGIDGSLYDNVGPAIYMGLKQAF